MTSQRTTLARVTYQRLFRRYLRLSGMTGTGLEVAPELKAVYGLDAVVIPPNRPLRRQDLGNAMHLSAAQKWQAVAAAAAQQRAAGRAVLVGTRSVAASEALAAVLSSAQVEHVVLNARQDGDEAQIVARAGEAGRITIATNMAGRGTDIALSPEVAKHGGLHVILTEFHESRRIDRQLFGRCARQGDAGSCQAIVCLDDDLFVRHAGAATRSLRSHFAASTLALPGVLATPLRVLAQRQAEQTNAYIRRLTLEQDTQLDSALAFTGKVA